MLLATSSLYMNNGNSLLQQLSESSRQYCLGAPLSRVAIKFQDKEEAINVPISQTLPSAGNQDNPLAVTHDARLATFQ